MLAVGLAASSNGCSLALSGPAANRPRNRPPTCDTGKGVVGLDGTLAATSGLVGLGGLVGGSGELGAVGIIGAVVFGVAAASGNSKVNACRAAFNDYTIASTGAPVDAPEVGKLGAPVLPATTGTGAAMPPRPPLHALEPDPAPAPTTVATPPVDPPPAPTKTTKPAVPTKPAAPASAPADDDDWSQFWKEAP